MEWDEWYLDVCNVVATKSNCLSRKIGSVLVRDKSIISQGYNGPPRGLPHCGVRHNYDLKLLTEYIKLDPNFNCIEVNKCPRQIMGFKSGEGLVWCVAEHSETNAIINAARHGISTFRTKLYMNCGIPCKDCLKTIINSGIEEIIITKLQYYDISSEYLLKQSNLKYRVFDHLRGNNNEGKY